MEFTCTICLINKKQKGHVMCSVCKEDFEQSVLKNLKSKKTPETLFQYAERVTQDNLSRYKIDYQSLRNSLNAFWNQSCKEIKRECRNIRLSKNNFLTAVRERYEELLKGVGQSEDLKRMKSLKDTIRILESQLDWFAKIKQLKQAKAERKDAVA